MRREHVELDGHAVIAYGHWGRPVVVLPDEGGRAWGPEQHGLVGAVADLLEAGRVKLYCVDSFDAWTWSDTSLPTEERARRHGGFETWIVDRVLPWVSADCGGATEFLATGVSLGAYHAASLCLRRADLFPAALCLSGNYDPSRWRAWGEFGDAAWHANPFAWLPPVEGGHLARLRERVSLSLVVGQGDWEVEPTGALPGTIAFADLLASKGIRHELDVWGPDVPHDWPAWQRQLAHHLPRWC